MSEAARVVATTWMVYSVPQGSALWNDRSKDYCVADHGSAVAGFASLSNYKRDRAALVMARRRPVGRRMVDPVWMGEGRGEFRR